MELEKLSAAELGRLTGSRKISPREVIDYFEKRIDARNPSINAFVYTRFDEARERAAELEKRIMAGEDCGPFAGVPMALKDFLPSKKGWTNSHGGVKSLIRTDTEDSEFCRAAEALGAIAVGKTNAPAFAFRGTTDNRLYGPTSTPFRPGYNSGGSSGGSAAAVADGLIGFGEGSDGGGSIRIPSAWCGCFGFKPSVGSVPSVCRPDGWTATHPYCFNGAITRTVEDSAIIYDRMTHFNPRDPYSLPGGPAGLRQAAAQESLKGMRIALTTDFNVFPTEKEIVDKVAQAAFSLKELGAEVEYADFGIHTPVDEIARMWCRSISVDTAIDLELWKREGLDLVSDHRGEIPEEFIYWNEQAAKSTIMDFRRFNEIRTELLDAHEDIFERFDAIIAPTTACLPVKNSTDGNTKGPESIGGVAVDPLIGFCETFFENFTGNPACSIPAGISADGLPVGMQIICRRFRDADVFRIAGAYEKLRPWSYDIPFGRQL